jgi:hypothetical protein
VQAQGYLGTVVATCTNGDWTYAGSCAGGLADLTCMPVPQQAACFRFLTWCFMQGAAGKAWCLQKQNTPCLLFQQPVHNLLSYFAGCSSLVAACSFTITCLSCCWPACHPNTVAAGPSSCPTPPNRTPGYVWTPAAGCTSGSATVGDTCTGSCATGYTATPSGTTIHATCDASRLFTVTGECAPNSKWPGGLEPQQIRSFENCTG